MNQLKVSTMTYIGSINTDTHIKDIYSQYVNRAFHDDLYIENKATKFNKKGKFVKSFGNQLTIKSKRRKYNIKLFFNNKFQITGIKSDEDVERIIYAIKTTLHVDMLNPVMVMKNVTLKMDRNPEHMIHLYDLCAKLMDEGYESYYTPEIYPGIKLKYNSSTALIFATGSIIISTKKEEEIKELYDIISKNIYINVNDKTKQQDT